MKQSLICDAWVVSGDCGDVEMTSAYVVIISVYNPKRCFALYCLITVKRSSQDGPGFPAITMIKEVEITCRFITFD